ncbi:MAG: hypothetical protein AAFX09_02065 [Pseudomonadota bacterium]
MTKRYWYARRRADQVGRPTAFGKFHPIAWQGWAMFGVFLGCMAIGAGLMFEITAQGLERGWVGFALLTIIGGGLLLWSVVAKGDPNHTVADYRLGRVNHDE